MSLNQLIAEAYCYSYEIPWQAHDLSAYVPQGTILVYLQIDGGFTKAEPWDAVTIEVRQEGNENTNRSIVLDGIGTNQSNNADGRDYVWVPVDPIKCKIEFRIWDIDTPGVYAWGGVYLKGYISSR